MTDEETIKRLTKWVKRNGQVNSWPTEHCDYKQHARFVRWRDKFWYELSGTVPYKDFVLDYIEKLKKGMVPPFKPFTD